MALLNKYHAELISKYSFVDRAFVQGAEIIIVYHKDGKEKRRSLPRRATVPQLQSVIRFIREDMGVSVYGKAFRGDIFVTAE